jgi:hypothetical protein
VLIKKAAGLYHYAQRGDSAWVEVFVDQTLQYRGEGRWIVKIPVLRNIILSSVLFHEIGHHIHATARPEFREKEDVANKWKAKLQRLYFHAQYPGLITVMLLLRRLVLLYRKSHDRPAGRRRA